MHAIENPVIKNNDLKIVIIVEFALLYWLTKMISNVTRYKTWKKIKIRHNFLLRNNISGAVTCRIVILLKRMENT